MKCKECGFEMPDGSAFCPKCGKPQDGALTGKAQEGMEKGGAPSVPVGAEAPSAANKTKAACADETVNEKATSASAQKSSANGGKSRAMIIGVVAIVAVVAIGAIAFLSLSSGNVAEETVKRAVQSTEFAQEGVVPSDYVNESPYQVTEFKIDSQKDEKGSGGLGTALVQEAYGTDTVRHVMFSGKIANESFETSFSGDAYYVKQGNEWEEAWSPSVQSTGSIPLKGVDRITKDSDGKTSTNGVANEVASYDGFTSTLDSDNGAYSSQADVTATYTFWFATDTAHNSLTFDFKGDDGWAPRGDVQVSDAKTNWTLSGKTFEGTAKLTHGTGKASLSFGDAAGNALSAAYSVSFTPDSDASKSVPFLSITYNAVDLSGNMQGEPIHEFGSSKFSVDLNDAEQSVTFSCSANDGSSKVVAGQGDVNTLSADVVTNSVAQVVGNAETNLKLSSLALAQNV